MTCWHAAHVPVTPVRADRASFAWCGTVDRIGGTSAEKNRAAEAALTALVQRARGEGEDAARGTAPSSRARGGAGAPRRAGVPGDFGAIAVSLASDASSHHSGATFIDAAYSMF